MIRIDPPPLATWILENLTPPGSDDALAGDLMEQYRAGRSAAWFWRQTIAACVAGWAQSLRSRLPLLVFALLWSMLAPAWTAVVDRLQENGAAFGPIWHMDFPFSGVSRVGAWLLLNLAYLWVGILIYAASHCGVRSVFRFPKLSKSLALAGGLFLPLYFVTFAITNLLLWPGLMAERRAMTPLGGITDLALWADVLRIPYALTMVFALWGTARCWRPLAVGPSVSSPSSTGIRDMEPASIRFDLFTAKRFFALVTGAAVMNALLVSKLLCQLPDTHASGLGSLLTRAVLYMGCGALGGIAGAWLYWNSPASPFREASPIPFSLFALVCATGCLWAPAIMIFYEQVSPGSAVVAMLAAIAFAPGLHRAMLPVFASAGEPQQNSASSALFADALYRPPLDASGYVIAGCLYLAGWALTAQWNLTGAALLGSAAFLFTWNRSEPRHDLAGIDVEMRHAGRRLALVAIPVLLITVWALLDGMAHRSQLEATGSGLHAGTAPSAASRPVKRIGGGLADYESVILWTVPQKKEIVAPVPAGPPLLAPETQRPMIIPFDGAYWYVQPPDQSPGRNAYRAVGTPLAYEIRSNNSLPLMMQAHQQLGRAVPLRDCGAIEVDLENWENHPGAIGIAVLLKDSSAPREAVYLGEQPISSSEPGRFAVKSGPVQDSVRFAVPEHGKVHGFDSISILVLPDWERSKAAPKVAIRQFRLFPR